MLTKLQRQAMADCNAGFLQEAEMKLQEALEIARELRASVLEANGLNSLGIVFSLQGRDEMAFACYTMALHLIENKIGKDHFFHRTVSKNLTRARDGCEKIEGIRYKEVQ